MCKDQLRECRICRMVSMSVGDISGSSDVLSMSDSSIDQTRFSLGGVGNCKNNFLRSSLVSLS